LCSFINTNESVRLQTEFQQATERPWLKIEEISASDVFGGLHYYGGKNTPASLPIHMKLKNIGPAPAFDVVVGMWVSFTREPQPVSERRRQCLTIGNVYGVVTVAADNTNFIPVIFPQDTEPYDGSGIIIKAEDIVKYSTPSNPPLFNLWFYGCVHYYASGKKNSTPNRLCL
jgi:hypothetical protein